MTVVLIDDEELARREMRRLLAHHPEVEIIGEAEGFTSATDVLGRVRPDLVFLDIQMPGRSGFDLLAHLPTPLPRIVFVTAHDAFALRAFEVNALDYLLKPVHPDRLARALSRVQEGITGTEKFALNAEEQRQLPATEASFSETDQIFLREGDRCWFVPLREVKILETEGNHTRVFFRQESPLIHRPLALLEARLPEALFFRANRGQLINVNFIDSVEPWFSGSLRIRLRGGPEVEFSRRQAHLFRRRMGL